MCHRGFNRTTILALTAILLGLSTGAFAGGSGQIPKEPIKWSVKTTGPDTPHKPGEQFAIQLTAKIEDGWHLYATEQAEGGPTPTKIVMPAEQPFQPAGPMESSEPTIAMDPNFNLTTQYYEGQATFTIPVKVAAGAAAGKAEVKVNVTFQTCSAELCLPPKTVKLAVEVSLAAR
jgi:DsbC/DsbD-like thiol-disulfide interchange protein